MNKQTITIDITPAGTVSIEASGFTGNSCDKATEQIELVLGGGQLKKKPKPERFMPASTTQSINRTF